MQAWIAGASASPPDFDDFKTTAEASRDHIIGHIRGQVHRLVSIVDREQDKVSSSLSKPKVVAPDDSRKEGMVAMLQMTYEGPGEERPKGRRHDNDHIDIDDIRIAPTHEELLSTIPPFLPGNFYQAPHRCPPDSMERLLDIQFRLLREELLYV
jgi:hypothetical protein